MPSENREVIRVFCDESRQTKARYMILAGIWVPQKYIPEYEDACHTFRENYGLQNSHLKWTRVRKQKLKEYQGFVDIFFDFFNQHKVAFKSIVIDTVKYPLDAPINKKDAELGFYKFYYQLLLHGIIVKHNYIITLADRPNEKSTRLSALQIVLNRGLRKMHGLDKSIEVVKNIEAKPAKASNLIQIADILMGAIGYHYHDFHLVPNASDAKVNLANYIARRLGWSDLKIRTMPNHLFNIWLFNAKK